MEHRHLKRHPHHLIITSFASGCGDSFEDHDYDAKVAGPEGINAGNIHIRIIESQLKER